MKTLALILAFAVTGSLGDGFGHSNHRSGRRGGRQQQRFRSGRQEEAAVGGYAAAADAGAQPTYEGDGDIAGAPGAGDDNLAMLEKSVPGIPGEDYPIYAEVPETAFACDGQVDGGYYADPEADCQVFHICTADGQGGLAKYSFLCPNGTVFNQNYFICDWWFNFDCAEAENLYSLNDDIAAERDANDPNAAAAADTGYGAATSNDYDYAAAADYAAADYEVETEAPQPTYAEEVPAEAPPAGGYGAPEEEAPLNNYDAEREARRFRGSQRQGRSRGNNRNRGGRRQNNRRRPAGQRRGRQGRRFRG